MPLSHHIVLCCCIHNKNKSKLENVVCAIVTYFTITHIFVSLLPNQRISHNTPLQLLPRGGEAEDIFQLPPALCTHTLAALYTPVLLPVYSTVMHNVHRASFHLAYLLDQLLTTILPHTCPYPNQLAACNGYTLSLISQAQSQPYPLLHYQSRWLLTQWVELLIV